MAEPYRTVTMRGDTGDELLFHMLDESVSDKQALISAGAFAGRMGHTRPEFVSLTRNGETPHV